MMKRRLIWGVAAVLVLLGLAFVAPKIFASSNLQLPASQGAGAADVQSETVQIRPGAGMQAVIKASGSVIYRTETPVVIDVSGTVASVPVDAGDLVTAGQLLAAVDTVSLERAVTRAKLDVETAQNKLEQLRDPATAEELAEAVANLASAQSNLEDVKAGPSQAEMDAARANVAAAQAKYADITDDLSQDEVTKLKANLEQARVKLEKAQRAYDKIKWKGDVGATQESADLQSATIEYEAAKADYAVASQPASQADVQSGVSSIRDAQQRLDDLLAQPKPADIATAEAQVASAKSKLDQVQRGADDLEIQAAEIQLQQALVALEEALANLQAAQVKAPFSGVVTEVAVDVGQKIGGGQSVVTMADPADLGVEVLVAEVDVPRFDVGESVEISLDALPDRTFAGKVVRIDPKRVSSEGAVNYRVEIALDGRDVAGVRSGMTAVATLMSPANQSGNADESWLVPVNAVQDAGGSSVVQVIRDGMSITVTVQPGETQGDWRQVLSPELRADDQVVGTVSSYLSSESSGLPGMRGNSPFPRAPGAP